jgi:putative oxidoreductase
MKWIAIAARVVLGLLYLASAIMFFLKAFDAPPMEGDAGNFSTAMMNSGFMTVIKVIEIIGGILLLSGQFVRFAAVWIFPVTVGILFFHVLMAPDALLVPLVMVFLNAFLFVYYYDDYKVLLKR